MRSLFRHAQRFSAAPLNRRCIARLSTVNTVRITPSIRQATISFSRRPYSTVPPPENPNEPPNKPQIRPGNVAVTPETKRLLVWYIRDILNKDQEPPNVFDEDGLVKLLEKEGIDPAAVQDLINVETHGPQHLSNWPLLGYFVTKNLELHPDWIDSANKRMKEKFVDEEWGALKDRWNDRVKSIKDLFGASTQSNQPKSTSNDSQNQPKGQSGPSPKPNFNSNQSKQRNQKQNQQDQNKSPWGSSGQLLNWNTVFITGLTAYLFSTMVMPGEMTKDITWQELRKNFLDKGLVEKIVVYNGRRGKVYLHRQAVAALYPDSPAANPNFFYYFTIGSVDSFERQLNEAQDELSVAPSERIPVGYEDNVPWLQAILNLTPHLLFIAFLVWSVRRAGGGASSGGGIFGMGKSRAKRFNHETDIKVKFADVAGMDEAKVEIMEFVSFLKEPWVYQKLGAKIPRGAILSGPPGTGKTLLAKATAGESGVPFFSVSGSEFVEMFVGVGPSRVRDLFATARKNTPCIIFIDEIDAIGRARSAKNFGGGNDERESTLNQILTEMDGFNTSDQVVVMAGTNRVDILDKALLRPGRFDRHIVIDRPTMDGRKQIFAVHLKKIVTHEEMEHLQGRLAALTPGFSGADIANCVNEAALIAARERSESVTVSHFERAIERVIGGLERKSLVLSPEEKRTIAYHEAGHAICGWFFRWADPLLKVSIIPRGQGALGYAQYLPSNGDTYLLNVNQMMDRMAMTLGGRVSEELHFETVTSGASDDFKKVTQMATMMVTRFGMSRKIGYLSFDDNGEQQFQKPFSEATAKDIDDEVKRIVGEAEKQCRDLLTDKKKEIGLVAEELLKKEVLSRDDLIRLLGKRPFDDKGEFHKYFTGEGPATGKDGLPPTDVPRTPPEDDGGMSRGGSSGPQPQPQLFEGRKDL